MPIDLRAVVLRTTLEHAIGGTVHVKLLDGRTHIQAPAPGPRDAAVWEAVMRALRNADRWGSTDTGGTPQIWAEVTEG